MIKKTKMKTIKKIEEFIRERCRTGIGAAADSTENDSVRQILHESLNMQIFWMKTVQQYFIPEQKERERTSVWMFQTALSEIRIC